MYARFWLIRFSVVVCAVAGLAHVANAAGYGTGAGAGETSSTRASLTGDFGTLLTHVGTADFSSAIGAIASSMHFNVLRVTDPGPGDASRLDRVLAFRSGEIEHMRSVLGASIRATRALEDAGISIDQVVWIAGEGEYMMHLYAVDR